MENIEAKLDIIEKWFSVPSKKLINVYNIVKEKGIMSSEDYRQITDIGIPIINKLSNATGLSIEKVRSTIIQKGISFNYFHEAIISYSEFCTKEK
ncbi:hypothetical protein [Chryseobacterium sp. EZn1]|uniref:hypothetical protein n=1 Tax=Chryseobacterium cupriresistens TaxID=3366770 RepID=UPI00398532D7